MANYRPSTLCSLPLTLDPNEYFNLSPEKRRADEERAALRANLKRQYQLQLNNPQRKALIEDPALALWVNARTNPNPLYRTTLKNSMLGLVGGIAPLFLLYYLFKSHRDGREVKIKAGTYERNYHLAH
ncbi:NADH dehydrogenase [ubiquinone] 1 beta subcomplex subunit 4 [Centropristis striata]|uniref:NADH dehydrogenase [ubiquinone] 1 beta subcomplex subunit 4 n=1 Tax=Centropristis striata TaxID=184440 RepID=UPI0027E1ED12|nr:NADH dehydrogenase [ubiquinone] 1 beta subcomplex subunit 4 [Centropristis striata]